MESVAMNKTTTKMGIQNLAYLEQSYAAYQRNADSVTAEWRDLFFEMANGRAGVSQLGPSFKPATVFNPIEMASAERVGFQPSPLAASLRDRLQQMIHSYRAHGHRIAAFNPLETTSPH